jgi:peptidyl-prolyl cis-trans isomerase C
MKAARILLFALMLISLPVLAQTVQDKTAAPAANDDHAKQVIAKMGDKVITVGDIEEELAKIPPQFISHFTDPQRKMQYIQSIVDRMVFSEEAKARGFLAREDIKSKIDSYVERVLYSEFLKTLTEGLTVSDQEVASYYEQHKDEFMAPEKIKAKHILVKTEEEAANITAELDKGASWDEMAKKYSIDKNNATRGGDLGYFSRGRMVKEFDDLAFSLEVGKVGGPVKTPFGYHLIMVEDKRPAEMQTLEQVDKQVRNKLMGLEREQKMDTARKELISKYQVEVHWDKVDSIQVGSGAPTGMPPGQAGMPMRMGQQPRIIKSEPVSPNKKEPEK